MIPLKKPFFSKGSYLGISNDHVIEHPNFNKIERSAQTFRYAAICSRWFSDSGRVVMRENHSGRIQLQASAQDFPWINTGTIYRAEKHFFISDQTMLVVQKSTAKTSLP